MTELIKLKTGEKTFHYRIPSNRQMPGKDITDPLSPQTNIGILFLQKMKSRENFTRIKIFSKKINQMVACCTPFWVVSDSVLPDM